ncbi:MAG: ATP-binding protein [Clostridiales bacterium]|nr:ATP-binding protein [Clostridiales bacterium]
MKKKLMLCFCVVIVLGAIITGFLSINRAKDSYLKDSEDKLISNGRLISGSLAEELKLQKYNYDDTAKYFSGIVNAKVTIIDKYGRVLGKSETGIDNIYDYSELEEVNEAFKGNTGKSIRYSADYKTKIIYVAVPLKKDVSAAALVLSLPLYDTNKIEYSFIGDILISALILFILSLIISFLFTRNITKPVKEMTFLSKLIAEGKLNREISVYSDDEIGNLAEAFNNMTKKLRVTIDDLYDKKNKLEAILKSMQGGVIAIDNNERIMLVNPEAMNIFGFDENVLGKHLLEVIRNVEFEDILYKHQDENRELRINYPKDMILRVKAAPITDMENGNRKIGIVAIMLDITELKQLEQMKTEFVANVSHELKTPLTSIKGFAETLKSGAINDNKTRDKFLDIINVEADRLTRLINDILTLSELEGRKKRWMVFEKIDMNDVMDEIEDMMGSLAKLKKIDIKFIRDKDGSYVSGNYDRIKQMLINLTDNAIKYTPEGGSVTVKTYKKDDKVYVEVSDTGIGIAKEHLPRLFERFYRVDKGRSRALGGTGLGLAIVKHIVSTMNGNIKVESELGKGTTFTASFPKISD